MNLLMQLYWIRRMGCTRRFHSLLKLHQEETILHHSASAALIAIQLFGNKVTVPLLTALLMHDLPEGFTGDIPAPVKWTLGKDALKGVEASIFKHHDLKYPELSESEHWMLKCADTIDAMFTCLLERAKGNRDVDFVFDNYRKFLKKNPLAPRVLTLGRFSHPDSEKVMGILNTIQEVYSEFEESGIDLNMELDIKRSGYVWESLK